MVTPPEGPHKLQLPREKVDAFLSQLAELPDQKRLRWNRYQIRPGDSLSVIAQRHNTTTQALKQANNLQNDIILTGKWLHIPTGGKPRGAHAMLAKRAKPQQQQPQRRGTNQRYRVKKGDSLWNIALAYNVDHKQLAKWNNLRSNSILQPGQKLIIRSKPTNEVLVSLADTQDTAKQNQVSYEVKRGDSLYRIAERFNVTIPELKEWNALAEEFLHPGQRIKLYLTTDQQTL
jgi:membrane-bound lytic murein transglycosylase D